MFSYLSYISGREGKKWVILGRRRRSTKLGERKWVASFKGIQISGYNCGTKQCNRNVLLWENKHLLQRKYIIALLLPYKMIVLNPSLYIIWCCIHTTTQLGIIRSRQWWSPGSTILARCTSVFILVLASNAWFALATAWERTSWAVSCRKKIENFVKAFRRKPEARIWEDLLLRL